MISSKAELRKIIHSLIEESRQTSYDNFITGLHIRVLKEKVRFPLLEFATREIVQGVPAEDLIEITDRIISMDEIGSYVLAGIILQHRLQEHFPASIDKAVEYIIKGDKWYVCDIIGERVMGYSLLVNPEKTISVLQELTRHANKWIVRSVGVATHYAVKKGVGKDYVEQLFLLLSGLANTTEFHTKTGIGWGAKTIAKFYPDIIEKYANEIAVNREIKQWFRTKIKIGLGRRSKYAARYNR